MPLSAAEILDYLARQAPQPLTAPEILQNFTLNAAERKAAGRLLKELAAEGSLFQHKGDRYSLPRRVNLLVGTASAHRDGYGFVTPDDKSGADAFIPARHMRGVMNGDRVVVRIERSGRGGKTEGRIIRVLERAHQSIVGRYEAGRKFGYVVPADPRLGQDIFIPAGGDGGARAGQMVMARIDAYPGATRNPEGTIIQVLGEPGDPEVEILTLVHKHGLPHQFPAEILAAAARVPQEVGEAERAGRKDLREIPLVTIDGETARDFDDAVAVRAEGNGTIRLWVAIADVAHYVPENSDIDREARERGTSVYFPGSCIPMLPEALSNGICSLNPGVERLAMVAEMLFDGQGELLESHFYPAVMRSRARLTYTEVASILDPTASGEVQYEELPPALRLMQELALRLMAKRRQRGSLDFDLPEAQIVLDLRGRLENIVRAERNIAHRLIEEFMLAANEAVAAFLTAREAPLLYRIHEPPDPEKLAAFQEFIAHFNYGLVLERGGAMALRLQRLLADLEGQLEERMINRVLLRSMKQARYAPENAGHFGLAADCYCHFTSPIRRYPDLTIHRMLRQVLVQGQLPHDEKNRIKGELPALGELTSQRERRAMEAEREIIDLKKCQFMADRVGEIFDGSIAGVQPFGFFVELREFLVEGLVHISSVADDFYHYEENLHRLIGENRRRVFQIGAAVKVQVAKVDLDRRQIDFVLAEEQKDTPPKASDGPRRTRRNSKDGKDKSETGTAPRRRKGRKEK
jgi:ribonuclease R